MGTHAKVSGFTLIELLIALAIFGMVVGIASYGYSLFARNWEVKLGRFQAAQDQYQRLDLVVAALENTLPYVVRDESGAGGFYFLGREEGLTLVTMSPVFSPGGLAVIRVFREPATGGKWNLLYEEAPLAGMELRLASQRLPFMHRLTVLRELPDISFRYFGWRSLDERLKMADRPELGFAPTWLAEVDGLVARTHPQRIAIGLGASEVVVFVPERADASFRRYVGRE